MNKVSSILARKGSQAVSVSPATTVIDALKIMAEKNIGSVIVMQDEKYMGIMTERDYSRKVALKGKSSNDTKVSEIMSTNLPSVSPGDSIEHCMQLMSDKNIRYMPVFENNQLAGIISMSDVVKETISSQEQTISHLESYIHSNI
ncbi:MAG: CBS domain-containing protein [Chitinophagales bacterium]